MDSFRDLSHDVSLGLRSSGLSAQFAYTLSKAMNVQAVKQSLYGSAVEPPRFRGLEYAGKRNEPGESAALRSAFHQDCIRILHQAVSMLAQALAAV